MQRDAIYWAEELRRKGLNWPDDQPQWDDTLSDGKRADLENAYMCLVQGCPRNRQNQEVFAAAAKKKHPVKLGVRMLAREAGHSPTTAYKHFLVVRLIEATGSAEMKSVEISRPRDADELERELELAKKEIARLQAINNQLAQANIELDIKIKQVDTGRQSAIKASRTLKKMSDDNVTPIKR